LQCTKKAPRRDFRKEKRKRGARRIFARVKEKLGENSIQNEYEGEDLRHRGKSLQKKGKT